MNGSEQAQGKGKGMPVARCDVLHADVTAFDTPMRG